jgi:membrane-associated protease RseP (regulator of RpoE activity)
MRKMLAILLIMLILIAGCARSPVTQSPLKPEAVVANFLQSLSNGDVDSCLNLMSDDAIINQDPPGVQVEGKAQIEASLRRGTTGHQQYSVISPIKADGDKVTLSVKVTSDDLKISGLEYMTTNVELQVQEGKIKSWLSVPNSDDWKRLVELTAGGIGVKIEVVAQGIKVTELAKNSPAIEAGLRPGDLIIAVNGISFSQMREGEIQLRIRGPVGSKVKLTVTHEGAPAPSDIEITRIDMTQLRY